MFLVRYVALAALLVWIGGAAFLLLHPEAGPATTTFHQTGAVCGFVVVVSLFFMKFIGPPPPAFSIRAPLAAVMTLGEIAAVVLAEDSRVLLAVTTALGFVLLSWYSRE